MKASSLVATLEKAWSDIQFINEEIPNAVIIVGSGGRRATSLYGYFEPRTWQDIEGEQIHEVFIVAEQLKRGALAIFTTLLHESVHALANKRGIKDCNKRRHNRKFAGLAEELGMIPPAKADRSLGYSACTLSAHTEELFEKTIKMIDDELKIFRLLKLVEEDKPKTSWSAECDCGRKIRIGKTIYQPDLAEDISIECKICQTEFVVEA